MAYNPTNWECGDVVTAEKLNHMEEAIENLSLAIEGGGGSVLTVSPTSFENDGTATITFDKTWQEIKDALDAHIPCYLTINLDGICAFTTLDEISTGMFPIVRATASGGAECFVFLADFQGNSFDLEASAPNGSVFYSAVCGE